MTGLLVALLPALPLRAWAQLAAPPNNLYGADLRTWLKTNWYDGRHRTLSYFTARQRMYNVIDNESNGPDANTVIDVYGGIRHALPYGGTVSNPDPINCEHTVPQSFFESALPMVSDLHHLFPVYNLWNSTRSNNPFTGISAGSVTTWMRGTTSQSTAPPVAEQHLWSRYCCSKFTPPKAHRGNLARAVMYFYTAYPTQAGSITSVINIDTLYAWHLADPVDAKEQARNNRIEAAQGTRNPYIDYPDMAARAWGIVTCSGTPGTQASALSVTNITASGMTLSFTKGSADARLVIMEAAGSAAGTPVNNTTYSANANFSLAPSLGTSKVVYFGSGTSVTVSGLSAGTSYAIKVFEACSNGPSYRTSSPLTGTASTVTCTAPSLQASSVSMGSYVVNTGNNTVSATISFTAGNGAKRLVVMRQSGDVNFTPVNSTSYTANTDFSAATDQGNGNKVVYAASGTSVTVSNLTPNTQYYVKVFEYCESSSIPNYNTSNAPTANGVTPKTCSALPTVQVPSLTATNLASGSVTLNIGEGNGTARLVLLRAGGAVSFTPVNGTAYTANSIFSAATDLGSGNRAVFAGSGATVNVTGLTANTSYYAQAFEYCATTNHYLTTAAPTLQFSTSGTSELFISEYVEGSSNNKGIEIYNATSAEIDLTGYSLRVYANGASTGTTINLTGTVDDGEAFVLANPLASFAASAHQTSGSLNINGNDAVALFRNSTMIDLVGRIGCDPGTAWTATGGYSTADKTLRRRTTVCQGITTNFTGTCGASSFTTLASEWTVHDMDDLTDLGLHTSSCGGTSASISTNSLAASTWCVPTAGQALSVSYAVSGSFESANVFSAQLSSATGSFDSPVTIGTLSSATNGTIAATLPGSLTAGTGYRVRVVSSAPQVEGTDNGTSITIASAAPQITGLSGTGTNSTVTLGWTNPTTCWDEVMIVARPSAFTTGTPSGGGSSYTANASYSAANTFTDTDAKIIYKGTGTSASVTNLTPGVSYYFSAFSRSGTSWSAAATTTITPVDLSGTLYRSKATGNWSATGSWEVSTNGGSSWANASSTPTSANCNGVAIRSPHNITIDAALSMDQVVVEAGATLTRAGGITLTIDDGTGDDLIIFGTLVHAASTSLAVPSGSGTIRVKTGGMIRVTGVSGSTGDDYANNDTPAFTSRMTWEDGAIFNWAVNSVFAASGQTFFPNNSSGVAKPIFRISTSIASAVGGSSATIVNGIFEVSSGVSMTWGGASNKTFRFGVDGGGTMIMGTGVTNNNFIVDGANAIIGLSTITVASGRSFTVSSSATLTKNVSITGGTLVISGTLNMQGFTISGASTVTASGNLLTANENGLTGSSSTAFGNTSVAITFTSGKVFYNREGAQTISNHSYNKLVIGGSGLKTVGTFSVADTLLLTGSAEMAASTGATFTMGGRMVVSGSARMNSSCRSQLTITTSNLNGSTAFSSNGSPIYALDLTVTKNMGGMTMNPGTPLDIGRNFTVSVADIGPVSTGVNTVTVGGNVSLSGASYGYSFEGPFIVTGSNGGTVQLKNSSDGAPVPTFANLIFRPAANCIGYEVLPSTGTGILNVRNLQIDRFSGQSIQFYNNELQLSRSLTNESAHPLTTGGAARLSLLPLIDTISLTLNQPLTIDNADGYYGIGQLEGSLYVTDQMNGDDLTWQGGGTIYINNQLNRNLYLGPIATVFNRAGAQTIPPLEYYSLGVAGTGTKTVSNGTVVTNTLSLAGSGTLQCSQGLAVQGNVYGSGEAVAVTGSLNMTGSSQQTINAPGLSIEQLVIDNGSVGADQVLIDGALSVGILAFQQGHARVTNSYVDITNYLTGESAAGYLKGLVAETRTASANSTATFSLGVSIANGNNGTGLTRVWRNVGQSLNINGGTSASRYYRIEPEFDSGLDATATFSYFDGELGGLDEDNLALYRRTDDGSPWEKIGGTMSTSANTLTATGIDHFSDWAIGSADFILPVRWGHFKGTAEKAGARLTWSTLNEQNNQGFYIERSADGRSFSEVGFVKGAGTSFGRQNYQFVDAGFSGRAWYRLRQVDFDGKQDFSPTLLLDARAETRISLLENPAAPGRHQLLAEGAAPGLIAATLTDAAGKNLGESVGSIADLNQWLSGQTRTTGIYLLHLQCGTGTWRFKIVVR